MVKFHKDSQHLHDPRIGGPEDGRLGSLYKHLAGERDYKKKAIGIVTLMQQVLERDVAEFDRLVSGNSQ